MPYAASGLGIVAHGNGNAVFVYRSADPLTEILGTGYFNSAGPQMQAGDEILVQARSTAANPAPFRLRVISATTSAVVVQAQHGLLSYVQFLPVTAVANTDWSFTLPPCSLVRATTRTTTAYGAVTNANFTLGTTVGGGEVIASVDVKAAGVVAHTIVAAQAGFAGGTLNIRIAQVGGNSAVGAAVFALEYVPT